MGIRVPKPVLVVVAIVLVGLLGWGGWVWTHPTLLPNGQLGMEVYGYQRPVADGTLNVQVAAPVEGTDAETITFDSASAHFSSNTARAMATFSICIPRQDSNLTLANDFGDLGEYCTKVVPIRDGTKMRWADAPSPNPSYLVLTITPHQPGKAEVDQVSFTYSRSWKHFKQHGTSHASTMIVVRAK